MTTPDQAREAARTVQLSILACAMHGFHAIELSASDGHGIRLTPSKCCGSWSTVKTWTVPANRMLDDLRSLCPDLAAAEVSRAVEAERDAFERLCIEALASLPRETGNRLRRQGVHALLDEIKARVRARGTNGVQP